MEGARDLPPAAPPGRTADAAPIGSPVPLPDHEHTAPPDVVEVEVIAGAVASATAPEGGLTPVQRTVLNSMCEFLLGVHVDLGSTAHVGPEEFRGGDAPSRERTPRASCKRCSSASYC